MKAAILKNWQCIEVASIDAPQPAAGEVLIRVSRAGVCGSDVHIYNGDNPIAVAPVIQGHEFMGRIEATGTGIAGFNAGQRVVIQPLVFCGSCTPCSRGIPHVCENLTVIGVNRHGGFAENVCVPADTLFAVPDDLPDNVAVLAEPFSIGFHACQRGAIKATDRVLVIGGGPIGFYSAIVARQLGVQDVIVSEPLADRRHLIEAFRIDTIEPGQSGALQNLHERSGRQDYDLIIETSGTAQGLDFASQAAGVGARIVTLGFPAKNYADYNITRGIVRELSLIGSRVCTRSQFALTLDLLSRLHRDGQYDLSQLVTVPRNLEQVANSIKDVGSGTECAKILIEPC